MSLPTYTVIIPARNEEDYIANTINSVKKQDYDGKIEIIVVDNSSIDNTSAIATKMGVKVISEKRVGLPQARETGRLVAKGEVIVYVDADTLLPINYISTVQEAFERHPKTVAVSNRIDLYDATKTLKAVNDGFYIIIYPIQNFILKILGMQKQVLGGSFAVKSKTLKKIGGFNTNIEFSGEDLAISRELSKVGEITILNHLIATTSPRRFKAHGTVHTLGLYAKNFFSVLFLNKPADGTATRRFLKIILFIVVISLLIRYLDVVKWLLENPDRNPFYIILIILLILFYGFFHPRSSIFGKAISEFNTSEKMIALTFDDGPNPISTPKVLSILKNEKVKATFFVVGKNAEKYPELLRTICKEGHGIGNHSYRHSWLFPFQSRTKILNEVDHVQKTINKSLGNNKSAKIFRPPHGWKTPWMLSQLNAFGYHTIMWNVSIDYLPGVTTKAIKRRFITKTKQGSILLLHDSIWENPNDDRSRMLEALPEIIKELKNSGYRFVRVEDMI
jgi:peptidoglycan/xylan/chitin deacetylase (PgdA/CDA1 family)